MKNLKVGLSAIFLVLALQWLSLPFFTRLELLALDWRFNLAGPKPPTGQEVAIAAIDEKSIDLIGRWPWSRHIMAELVDRLVEYDVKTIGFDVVFSSPDESSGAANLLHLKDDLLAAQPENSAIAGVLDKAIEQSDNDGKLRTSLKNSKRAVLGYFFHFSKKGLEHIKEEEMEQFLDNIAASKYDGIKKEGGVNLRNIHLLQSYAVESNIQKISEVTKWAGFFNFVPDPDGAVRRVPLIIQYRDRVETPGEQDYLFAPLSITVLRKYLKAPILFWIHPSGVEKAAFMGTEPLEVPADRSGAMLINFRGPRETFPYFSIVDIIQKKVPAEALKDKIVLIGPTAAAIEDIRVTPFDKAFPGVEVHANIIDNILHQDFLTEPAWKERYNIASVLLLGFLLAVAVSRWGALWGAMISLVFLISFFGANQYVFSRYQLLLNMVYPILTMLSVYSSITMYRFMTEEREKKFIHGAFSQYLSPAVIEELVKDPSKLKLGGERKVLTAFFSDVAGFSTISEKLTPEELVALLNIYLTEMTDILMKYGGTVDKFEGDAIIAFFGAPVSFEDHAQRACLASLEMQKRLAELRAQWKKEGKPELRMRIGLNTGPMVVGNMGSRTRMDYTMMGDSVNLAARLEGVNKEYGTSTMISQFTREGLDREIVTRELDFIRVVGKKEPVTICELVGLKKELSPAELEILDIFHKGVLEYRKQNWKEAISHFREVLSRNENDGPSMTFFERCLDFQNNPPSKGWDGVYEMRSK